MKLSKMSKEDLELMPYTSIAKLYLEEKGEPQNTAELFKEVCNLLELSEKTYQDKITDFFQSLTTSKEFILLADGKWDLKTKHKVNIVMEDIYDDKDEEEEELEINNDEITEEDEYNSIDDEDEYAEDDLGDLTILSEEELEDSE